MKKTLVSFASAAFAASLHAAPITGAVSFEDGFNAAFYPDGHNFAIVSDITSVHVGDTTLASACTGVFGNNGTCVPNSGTFAQSFDIQDGARLVYAYNGFDFVANIFGPITRYALQCADGLCADQLVFGASGTVSGNGLDATPFLMSWTGQGTCVEWLPATNPLMCEGDNTRSWSASIASTGTTPVPVSTPGTLALTSLGLLALGWWAQRRA